VHDQVQVPGCAARPQGRFAHPDVEEFAEPTCAGDDPSVQHSRWRVEGLQRADRCHVDARDRVADHAVAQIGGEGLDLGQLRHAARLALPFLGIELPACFG
jgi:hypothetical protein